MSMDLKDKTLGELERIVVDMGGKKWLAAYVFQFIHIEGAAEISQITPLSKAFRQQFNELGYRIYRLIVADKLTDEDGTVKYLFEIGDGSRIETVLLLDGKRRTLCIFDPGRLCDGLPVLRYGQDRISAKPHCRRDRRTGQHCTERCRQNQ